jgi:hypothetical protein
MVSFAKQRRCSLKGIIDYEIAKKQNKKVFYVPVPYASIARPMALGDAVFYTNYLQTAKDVVENVKLYLAPRNIQVTPVLGFNNDGRFNILAYKIIVP